MIINDYATGGSFNKYENALTQTFVSNKKDKYNYFLWNALSFDIDKQIELFLNRQKIKYK